MYDLFDEVPLGLAPPVPYPQSMLMWAGMIGMFYMMYSGLYAYAAARR